MCTYVCVCVYACGYACVCVCTHMHTMCNFREGKAVIKRAASILMQVMEWKIPSYCSNC